MKIRVSKLRKSVFFTAIFVKTLAKLFLSVIIMADKIKEELL